MSFVPSFHAFAPRNAIVHCALVDRLRFSVGFIDQLPVFGVHVPPLAQLVINAGIGVDPDRTSERCRNPEDQKKE
jgi:hypothetical protein